MTRALRDDQYKDLHHPCPIMAKHKGHILVFLLSSWSKHVHSDLTNGDKRQASA